MYYLHAELYHNQYTGVDLRRVGSRMAKPPLFRVAQKKKT